MATVDLRTLPLREQHHSLAFNTLGRTGSNPSDFPWICPTCDDGRTHVPCVSAGGKGYVHMVSHQDGPNVWDLDEQMHQLVAVDVIAVLESWRQVFCHLESGTDWKMLRHVLDVGASPEMIALSTKQPEGKS
jgi:hypothetical protein